MGKPKQWKTGGVEDKTLSKLIKSGKINKFTKPTAVQNMNPAVFGGFNSQVMRNHLNVIKRTHGLFLDEDNEENDSNHSNDEDEPRENEIAAEKTDQAPIDSNNDFLSTTSDKSIKLNYPVMLTQYVCPITENEKVLMVVSLPGGATDPNVALQDDGIWVFVKYSWSKTLFDVHDLFKPQLDAGEFEEYHPLPTAYRTALSKVRQRIDLAPNGIIKVFLPIKVQTTSSSYKIWGIKRPDGTNVALATFTGFTKQYVNKTSDQELKYL